MPPRRPPAAPSTSCPAPTRAADDNVLNGLAARTDSDIWAVGSFVNANGYQRPLAEHWNGTAWTAMIGDALGPGITTLNGVAMLAADDVWAVGSGSTTAGGTPQTLIEHWDGSAWTVSPSPSPGADGNFLFDIAAVTASDIWAVGDQEQADGTFRTLIEHWDGSTWIGRRQPERGGQRQRPRRPRGARRGRHLGRGRLGDRRGRASHARRALGRHRVDRDPER